MDKSFKKLLKELKGLGLPDGEYTVYGSGPMAVRSIKPTKDLDVVVTEKLYKKLLKAYPGGKGGCIKIGDIEIFSVVSALIDNPEKVIKRAELIDGVRFIRLNDLIVWKRKMARPKDFEHIKMIENYLRQQN